MPPTASSRLAPAPDVANLDHATHRHTPDVGLQVAIGPDGTVAGPDGFRCCNVDFDAGGSLPPRLTDHHRVVIATHGALDVALNGETHRLAQRDAILAAPADTLTVEPGGPDTRAMVVDYRERDEHGEWTDIGATRRGVVRPTQMLTIRERVPVRWAPAIHDVLSPRSLYPLVGPVRRGPGRFGVYGPRGLVIALATTPRFTGPALHVHTLTTEMFVILEGQFRITWGDKGEHESILDAGDAIVIPQGVNRAFEAYGEGDNWILPVVVGADDETEDIAWLPAVAQKVREVGPRLLAELAMRVKLRIADRP